MEHTFTNSPSVKGLLVFAISLDTMNDAFNFDDASEVSSSFFNDEFNLFLTIYFWQGP